VKFTVFVDHFPKQFDLLTHAMSFRNPDQALSENLPATNP